MTRVIQHLACRSSYILFQLATSGFSSQLASLISCMRAAAIQLARWVKLLMAIISASRSWEILTQLILTLSCWRCQEDCTSDLGSTLANLNGELYCTDTGNSQLIGNSLYLIITIIVDADAGPEELSLNCTGSEYLISSNIPHNFIEFLSVGVVCGPDCVSYTKHQVMQVPIIEHVLC